MRFSAIAASAPCWYASPVDPHVQIVHSGSARGGYSDFVLALRASLRLLSPLRFGSLHLLPWMACMLALQEQMPVTEKSLFLEIPLSNIRIKHRDWRSTMYKYYDVVSAPVAATC